MDNVITYADIERVNSEIKPVPIKGNDYATVAARVQAFRKLFPLGRISITTVDKDDIVSFDSEGNTIRRRGVFCKAYIYPRYDCDTEQYLSTGSAEEIEGTSNINKVSFKENCETSAVGRALGFLGIGSTDDIASAEEVVNAQGYDQISKEKAEVLRTLIEDKGKDEGYICKFHKVKKLEDMTTRQYAEVVKWLG